MKDFGLLVKIFVGILRVTNKLDHLAVILESF